tara:strand:- start:118 stop:663 length:546 start_codon:yes stop_codon:yes gene_type:complete
MKILMTCTIIMIVSSTLSGCTSETSSTTSNGPLEKADADFVDSSAYLLSAEPKDATSVIRVREEAASDDEVLIVGCIGGSSNPWIEGRAAFTIVDLSLKSCNDTLEDKCPTPWDYCCETDKLPTSSALVKFVDNSNKVLKADPKTLFGVAELSTVIIKGSAQRDDADNLTVLASGIFVKKK